MADNRSLLLEELLQYFLEQGYSVNGVLGKDGYTSPPFLANDGFGDQQRKRPDIYAFDAARKCHVLGIVKTSEDNLESVQTLTEYDVFFDHRSKEFGTPSQVCFILPQSRIAEFSTIITHYLHPDYWRQLTIYRSKELL
jgi:hypothetical protein